MKTSSQHQFKTTFRKAIVLCVSVLLSSLGVMAQDQNLEKNILNMDAAFWQAYNSCDIPTMNNFLAKDIEFYHDKGGIELGSKQLNDGFRNGLCQTGENYLRREAITETIAVFPLMDNNEVYGAILSGEHLFYIKKEDSEYLDGQAKFNHLWLLKEGEWKMHRVLSYDHRAPQKNSGNSKVALQNVSLDHLTGNYTMPSKDVVTVEALEDRLKLVAMGKEFIIFPESETSFFSKDRELTFSFSAESPRKLEIFEGGNKVAEAVYSE